MTYRHSLRGYSAHLNRSVVLAVAVIGAVLANTSGPVAAATPPSPTGPASLATTVTSAPTASTTTTSTPGTKAAKGAAAPPAPVFPPVIVAPPGAAQLLANLRDEEGQLLSVPAYAEARSYLSRANVGEEAADRLVSQTLAVWTWAKADERQALAARAAAQVVVNAYKEALTQLAMAEYTGQAMVSKSNIVSLELQVYKGELAAFAATDTTAELLRAEAYLAACKRKVVAARALVAMDWGLVQQANGVWEAAVIQVSASTNALSIARGWVLQAGTAPARPAVALMAFEGKWAPPGAPPQRWPMLVPASAVPLPTTTVAPPTTTVPLPTTTVPSGASTAGTSSTTAGALTALPPGPMWAEKGPTIFGSSLLSASQIAAWYESTGAVPHTTIPLAKLVKDYIKAGKVTGVRPDIAFAQSMDETAYFSFPAYGQDPPGYNNFAGIGACNKCKHGWNFPNAMSGVLAQDTLLESYATPSQLSSADEGQTETPGVAGCCTTWISIGGIWSTNPSYGFEILGIYNEMLAWVLTSELQQLHLVAPGKPGVPGTAVLPASQPEKSGQAPSHSPPT
ncbi:MAG: glucosaminidase domain-containing protein [Acidimicrobiales bacterium]